MYKYLNETQSLILKRDLFQTNIHDMTTIKYRQIDQYSSYNS